MAEDDVADVVLSAAVFFEMFRTEDTDTDEDNANELCSARRRRQRPRRYWVHDGLFSVFFENNYLRFRNCVPRCYVILRR